jgi:hypothetical protein
MDALAHIATTTTPAALAAAVAAPNSTAMQAPIASLPLNTPVPSGQHQAVDVRNFLDFAKDLMTTTNGQEPSSSKGGDDTTATAPPAGTSAEAIPTNQEPPFFP